MADRDDITDDDIRAMTDWEPRRYRLADWTVLAQQDRKGGRWFVRLPFRATLMRAFNTMVDVELTWRQDKTKPHQVYAYVDDDDERARDKIRNWARTLGPHVAIRDWLALSFALDFSNAGGAPSGEATHVADLRRRAKPYDKPADASHRAAADELALLCVDFLKLVTAYNDASCVVAMPSSRPDKTFDLPAHLAARIAWAMRFKDLSPAVVTTKARRPLKSATVAQKLSTLQGTIMVKDRASIRGKIVLVIDDLYQSGTSLNYLGKLLLDAGAKTVYGLACEKTLRNDANVRDA